MAKVTGAKIAALSGDGFPEIYIYVNSNEVSNMGSIVAYVSNQNKSITPIYLPPLAEDPKVISGYTDGDECAGCGKFFRAKISTR
ncbi:hypothetical protein [Polynucleobacter necessarius]|uniref:hypothetical protein n=1 Tax=Polynucleobacter necessarius TaxID=576610 RepID=UPI000E9AF827|nr:hypothetical protein [Polynucleobacter necessarius]HAT40000.1 hypothetical protein [Polynucleobacter sp.]